MFVSLPQDRKERKAAAFSRVNLSSNLSLSFLCSLLPGVLILLTSFPGNLYVSDGLGGREYVAQGMGTRDGKRVLPKAAAQSWTQGSFPLQVSTGEGPENTRGLGLCSPPAGH